MIAITISLIIALAIGYWAARYIDLQDDMSLRAVSLEKRKIRAAWCLAKLGVEERRALQASDSDITIDDFDELASDMLDDYRKCMAAPDYDTMVPGAARDVAAELVVHLESYLSASAELDAVLDEEKRVGQAPVIAQLPPGAKVRGRRLYWEYEEDWITTWHDESLLDWFDRLTRNDGDLAKTMDESEADEALVPVGLHELAEE